MKDPELVEKFMRLRDAWFNKALKVYSHPRETEGEAAHIYRKSVNRSLRKRYDKDTLDIIEGKDKVIAPTIPNEVGF